LKFSRLLSRQRPRLFFCPWGASIPRHWYRGLHHCRKQSGKKERKQTEPVAVEVDGDERRWDSKIVDQRKQFDEERQLLRRCYELQTAATSFLIKTIFRLLRVCNV